MWHQVNDFATFEINAAGEPVYFTADDVRMQRFYLSDGFGPEVDNIGFNEENSEWKLRDDNEFKGITKSAWFALQSEFLDGRLRSLFGLRKDNIDIEYSLRKYRINTSLVGKGPDSGLPAWQQRVYVDPVTGERRGFTNDDVATQIEGARASYSEVSPTLGALYWLNPEFGIFANYARSIQSPTGIDVTPTGEIIPPVYGEGYEYGLRFDLFEGKLNGQIAAFYIEKENDDIVNYDQRLSDVYPVEDHPELYMERIVNGEPVMQISNENLPGKQVPGDMSRAEGVEVECYYNPNRNLSFTLSYTYNNLDAIKVNGNVNPRFAQVWGQAPHNALLIGRYKFTSGALRGLTVGANQSIRSSSSMGEWYIEDDNDNPGEGTWHEIEFDPEYVTSAFLNYERKLGKGRGVPVLNLGLRVSNLFDNTDLINRNKRAYHRASRQYLLSASLRF
jgi:outer membrane receptor protein involved in Fe transport